MDEHDTDDQPQNDVRATPPKENASPAEYNQASTSPQEPVAVPLAPSVSEQPIHPKKSKRLKIILILPLVIVLFIFGYIGYFVINLSVYCHDKTRDANHQATEQADELSSIVLFGSKPQISKQTNADCVDGNGSGSALATYTIHNVGLSDVQKQLAASLGGSESPLTITGEGDATSETWNRNDSNFNIIELLTTVTTPKDKTYYVQFKFTHPYACPSTCDTSDNVVQTYNLQNAPVNKIYVEVN